MARTLSPEELHRPCDTDLFRFRTSEEVAPLEEIIGQKRALDSIEFGLDLRRAGFNIYVLGDTGTGRTSAIRAFVGRLAEGGPVPRDWCYVFNFREPTEPVAISLEPGRGVEFRRDMAALVAHLRSEITKVYDSKEYKHQKNVITEEFSRKQQEMLGGLEKEAEGKGFRLRAAMGEFSIVPVDEKGEPITEEGFKALDEAKKKRLREDGLRIRERLDTVVGILKKAEKATRERLAELDRYAATSVLGPRVEEIRGRYPDHEKIGAYLNAVAADVLANIGDFRAPSEEGEQQPPLPFLKMARPEPDFTKYMVNVLVDNNGRKGSPCVFEGNPTYYNLFGRMEHRFHMGAALTDFTMIRAGSLHKANGGYLVINALDLLRNIFSYDALKRTIRSAEIRVEDVWEQYRLVSMAAMKPEPIPLDVKVILIGSPEIYYLLYNLDEEYRELFKVKADFDTRMDRTDENIARYAAFVSAKVREEKLRPFDPSGVGKLVEYGSRIAEHKEKLTSRFSDVSNLIRESDYWAGKAGASVVSGEHVEKAWNERVYRHSMIESLSREVMAEGTVIVDTAGEKVGQVNGLAVIDLGDYAFGKPSRITAAVYAGKAGVVNIERETKLSGKIHDKAVLILANYLGRRYATRKPINLTASLAFEQLYGMIEGDSATCAELYALLSALAGVPVRQNVAVTGSMDQTGTVQPIGAVNEKIEGFFELCRLRGLDGSHGVIIPRKNVVNLVLKREVVEAARAGKFHVYAIDRVEEGFEILFGMAAGEPGPEGAYPEGTLNRLVEDRLTALREAVREEPVEEEAPPEKEEETESVDEEDDGEENP